MFRNRLIELIQYASSTETVFETPLLLSPPWINKYYVMDLAPGKSFVEYAVEQGHTVFCISYRNPDESLRDLGFEDYLREGPLSALEVIGEITAAEQVNVVGLCLGGTLTAAMLAHLAGRKARRPSVRSATLLNALVDFSDPGPLGHFVDPTTVERLERRMAQNGYLSAEEMAGTFNLLRANDLVWRYVASGWLMGEDPPSFDILAWNADATRMPARMHSEYLRTMYLENRLAVGTLEIDGRVVSLAESKADLYVVSAREDHITPWRSCYRTTQLVGGPVRFVLTSSGHIAGIVNPPGPKRKHWLNEALPAEPDEWLAGAHEVQGSWWEDWARWISGAGRRAARSAAPRERGAPAARGRARDVRPQLIDIVRKIVYYTGQHANHTPFRKGIAMTTPLELSKAAQEQFLATIKQGQEIALTNVEVWASTVAPLVEAAPTPIATDLPTSEELVSNSFGFAEKLLASQKAFAQKVVAASAPVFSAATPAGTTKKLGLPIGGVSSRSLRRSTLQSVSPMEDPSWNEPTRGARRVHPHPTPARQHVAAPDGQPE